MDRVAKCYDRIASSTMRIQTFVEKAESIPNGWTRVDQIRQVPAGLVLDFSVHHGRGGKGLGRWTITCRGVHELNITELDGGGLAVYPSSHPAARQYMRRFATLRWPRSGDTPEVLAALQEAHLKTVDDWIPFDRYLRINTPYNGTPALPYFAPVSGNRFVCNGPEFLLKAYAKALAATGQQVQLRLRGVRNRKNAATASPALRFVLHRCRPFWCRTAIEPAQFRLKAVES